MMNLAILTLPEINLDALNGLVGNLDGMLIAGLKKPKFADGSKFQ